MDEQLILRARNLLGFLSPWEACLRLVDTGISKEFAYLAIVAAQILNKEVST